MTKQSEIERAKWLVRNTFKNSKGEPFEMTDGQAELFVLIYKKKYPRVHIETPTRYGKSEVISMAILSRIAHFPEKWVIVAGNTDKASIIMSYIIGHIFDSEFIHKRFSMDPGESEERIRRYKNKDRINFKVGEKLLGEVFITSAPEAMGKGAPNVVEDESALVSDNDHALVMRMLGDQTENFMCKVGNPWESGHFIKSFEDSSYHKLIIDYRQAIKEGRLTASYVEEMRKEAFFGVLYECKFPPPGMADEGNWVQLLSRDQIKKALVATGHPGFGIKKLGNDVAGGGRNFSVMVERRENVAKVRIRNHDPDTMNLAETIISECYDANNRKDKMVRQNVSIDKVGIGKGLYDIVNRNVPGVVGVNAGDKLDPKITRDLRDEIYINLRAKMFWLASLWIIAGGKLEMMAGEDEGNSVWYELSKIKYRTKLEGTKGKIVIMPKEQMLKDGIESPDVADALSLTFATPDIPFLEKEEQERINQDSGFNPFNPFMEM
jgi:hypothetical protein